MLPGAGCCFGGRKGEVVCKEGQVPFTSGKDEGREQKVRVMGERKWMWRRWTVWEGKDAIVERERRGEVNVAFWARCGGTIFAGGESDGFGGRWLLGGEGEGQELWHEGWWLGKMFAWLNQGDSVLLLEVMVVPWYVVAGNWRKHNSNVICTGHATVFCTGALFPKMVSV